MYEIIWSYRAEQDYLATLKFWISHNKSNSYSLKLANEVKKAEQYLSINPFAATPLDLQKNIYKIPVLRHFSIVFKAEKNTVNIVAFWDNRRNPNDLYM